MHRTMCVDTEPAYYLQAVLHAYYGYLVKTISAFVCNVYTELWPSSTLCALCSLGFVQLAACCGSFSIEAV